jgi:hypothetical protein
VRTLAKTLLPAVVVAHVSKMAALKHVNGPDQVVCSLSTKKTVLPEY